MNIFYPQFEIVEARFSHLGGTRNGTSGARIEKFQNTDPPKPPKRHLRNPHRTLWQGNSKWCPTDIPTNRHLSLMSCLGTAKNTAKLYGDALVWTAAFGLVRLIWIGTCTCTCKFVDIFEQNPIPHICIYMPKKSVFRVNRFHDILHPNCNILWRLFTRYNSLPFLSVCLFVLWSFCILSCITSEV